MLRAAPSPNPSLVLGASERAPRRPSGGGRYTARAGCAAAFCPRALGWRAARTYGRSRCRLSSSGSCALAGRPPLKAALTLPAARRPGLSHNPDLEAKALSWPPPTGGNQSGRRPGSSESCLLVDVCAPKWDDLGLRISLERSERPPTHTPGAGTSSLHPTGGRSFLSRADTFPSLLRSKVEPRRGLLPLPSRPTPRGGGPEPRFQPRLLPPSQLPIH